MKNVNPFELVVLKIVDELGFVYRENVWLPDLPKVVRDLVKSLGDTPLISFTVEFNGAPVMDRETGYMRDTLKKLPVNPYNW